MRRQLFKQLMAWLNKAAIWRAGKHLSLLPYAGLIGLAIGLTHRTLDLLWAMPALSLVTAAIVSAALLTRGLWTKHAKLLTTAQKCLGFLSLIGFLVLLVVGALLHSAVLSFGLILAQIGFLTALFVIASIQAGSSDPQAH